MIEFTIPAWFIILAGVLAMIATFTPAKIKRGNCRYFFIWPCKTETGTWLFLREGYEVEYWCEPRTENGVSYGITRNKYYTPKEYTFAAVKGEFDR